MNPPSHLLRTIAKSLKTMGQRVGDPWGPLADALERYANGTAQHVDFLRVQRHSDVVLEAVFIIAERDVMAEWLASLRDPAPKPPLQ
jgi:hypothetical protein